MKYFSERRNYDAVVRLLLREWDYLFFEMFMGPKIPIHSAEVMYGWQFCVKVELNAAASVSSVYQSHVFSGGGRMISHGGG